MNDRLIRLWQHARRRSVAALAPALLLVAGVTWSGFAADSQSAAGHVTTTTPSGSPTIAGGRDSYADIVKVVAPAVVTIRTEGRVRVSPTNFQGDDFFPDDFFRRFFGDEFDRRDRVPRTFRQRGLGSGVIVSGDGYILTNHHVIDGADQTSTSRTGERWTRSWSAPTSRATSRCSRSTVPICVR